MATPAGFEPATVRLEVGCSIQLSYGAGSWPAGILVCPGLLAIGVEVSAIGLYKPFPLFRWRNRECQALALGILDRLFLRLEGKADLSGRVVNAGPAHEGVCRALGVIVHEFENPGFGLASAGGHRAFGGLVDTRLHDEPHR